MMHAKWRLFLYSIICSLAVACSQAKGPNDVSGFFGSVARAPDFVAVAKTLQPAVVNVLATVSPSVRTGERG